MNCANHPDRERVAFCQNCGKPLCSECIRNVGTSTFCEPCLAARVAGNAPPAGYGYSAPPAPGEPNPGIAALLGLIPGVGAMYNEQYAKGIVHLIVFVVLVSLAQNANGIFGLFVVGWIAYMAIEAHHTAQARRDGTPLPNPFGLNDLSERLGFGKAWPSATPVDPAAATAPYTAPYTAPGAPFTPPVADPNAPPPNPYAPPYQYNYNYAYAPPVSQWGAPQGAPGQSAPPPAPYPDPNLPAPGYFDRFPSGAIWLIVLGVFFLLGRTHLFFFRGRVLAPILMIGFGVWLFVIKMMSTGHGLENDGTHYYRWRLGNALHRSAWIVLTGVLWLLDVLQIVSWRNSWPIYLIAAGVLLVFRHTTEGPYLPYAAPPVSTAPAPPATPAETTELARSDAHSSTGSSDPEGR
jgi:hypothetical protein